MAPIGLLSLQVLLWTRKIPAVFFIISYHKAAMTMETFRGSVYFSQYLAYGYPVITHKALKIFLTKFHEHALSYNYIWFFFFLK